MTLYILRGAFMVLVAAVIVLFVGTDFQQQAGFGFEVIAAIIGVTIAVAAVVIALDVSTANKRLSSVSGVFLGLVAGLTVAYALSFVVDLVGAYTAPTVDLVRPTVSETEFQAMSADEVLSFENRVGAYELQVARVAAFDNLLRGVKVIIGLITCYLAISLVLQTKDDFRFVIPYVEFAKEIRGNRPTLLDTSVIIDGRVLDVVETKLVQGAMIVPKFVLEELQQVADASDKIKRARGRRGLDILQKLQGTDTVEVRIEDRDADGANVDQKLISLAEALRARVMTNDFNLNKIATLRGIDVINMNELAAAVRPVVLPGERLDVKLVKAGESPNQGVGYLDDGTMVVVEGGRSHLNHRIGLVVTSTLQTAAGRMIFGRFDHDDDDAGPTPAGAPEAPAAGPERDDETAPGDGPPRAPARATPASGSRRNPRRG
ncbi:MAG: PIN domain-containing protein [Planctomycetota bacterium]